MKVLFMGTPEFSIAPLKAINENFKLELVVTQPDRKRGRGHKLRPSDVKEFCLNNNILVKTTDEINSLEDEIKKHEIDFIVVCAFGNILKKEITDNFICLNIHASILPNYRGASPIEAAILNGDKYSGITVIEMNENMDEGDLLYDEKINIENLYFDEISNKLSVLGSSSIVKVLKNIDYHMKNKVVQPKDATYTKKINKKDLLLDWDSSVEKIKNKVRAYKHAFTYFDSKLLKITEADIFKNELLKDVSTVVKVDKMGIYIQAKDGIILIKRVIPLGKKEMDAYSFSLGNKVKEGVKLGG